MLIGIQPDKKCRIRDATVECIVGIVDWMRFDEDGQAIISLDELRKIAKTMVGNKIINTNPYVYPFEFALGMMQFVPDAVKTIAGENHYISCSIRHIELVLRWYVERLAKIVGYDRSAGDIGFRTRGGSHLATEGLQRRACNDIALAYECNVGDVSIDNWEFAIRLMEAMANSFNGIRFEGR